MRVGRVVRAPWAALSFILAAALFSTWQLRHLGPWQYLTTYYPLDAADDWRYTACARLTAHGYHLFTQVFSAQPPVLFWSLAGGMQLFGDSLRGGQITEWLFALVGLGSAALIAYLLAGRFSGAVTALALAISPAFLVYSHAVEAEGPMMALGALGLAAQLLYHRTRYRPLLVLAGLAISGAILTKLFALEYLAPALVLLYPYRTGLRRALQDASLFLAAVAIPVVLDFALIAPAAQWAQVVAMHDRMISYAFPGLIPAPQLLLRFLQLDIGLALLGAAGLVLVALRRPCREAAFLWLWLVGSVLMLMTFHPLFPHHLAILLAPLAVSGGVAAGTLVRAPILLAALALLYAVFLPHLVRVDRHLLVPGPSPAVATLASFVQARSSPTQLVAVDDLAVADVAGRLVVPPLCDPSNVRMDAGYLTYHDLVIATRQYRPRLVVSSFGIYARVPRYLTWLAQHYHPIPAPEGAHAFASPQ